MDDPDDGDEHKKELCVKKDAEIVVDVCGGDAVVTNAYSVPRHKPDNREECRACEDVMGWVVFGDVYNTEYPYKKDNN
jgi:hypothetical protein